MLTEELMARVESTVVEELTEEQRNEGIPCFVEHRAAGGPCERPSVMLAYGLHFCEAHGKEAKIGALKELYEDIHDVVCRLDNTQVPLENRGASVMFGGVNEALLDRLHELSKSEDAALTSAYPTIAELVCSETRLHEYDKASGMSPYDVHAEDRLGNCNLMRQAYTKGMTWLVEALEFYRESSSTQLAFAIEDRAEKVAGLSAGSDK